MFQNSQVHIRDLINRQRPVKQSVRRHVQTTRPTHRVQGHLHLTEQSFVFQATKVTRLQIRPHVKPPVVSSVKPQRRQTFVRHLCAQGKWFE